MATPDELYAAKFAGKRPENTGANFVNIAGRQKAAGIKAPTVTSQSVKKPQTNVIGKAAAVASQTLDIAGAVGKRTAQFVGNTAVDVGKDVVVGLDSVADVFGVGSASFRLRNIQNQQKELSAKQDEIVSAYRNGKMSKENYTQSLKELTQSFQDLSKSSQKLEKDANPVKHAERTVMAAVDVLTLGVGTAAKATATAGVKTAGTKFLSGKAAMMVDSKLVDLVSKVPAARQLIERNAVKLATREAQKLAGETTTQWLTREGRRVAIGLLVKRPIFYQSNIGLAEDAYDDMMSGKYGSAAVEAGFIGAQMIGGGPIGWFLNKGKKIMGDIKALALGQGSFIDAISRRVGQNPTWMAQRLLDLRKTNPEKAQQIENSLRILQEVNLKMAGDDAERAADLFMRTYTDTGTDLTRLSFEELTTRADKWVRSYDTINQMVKSGLVEGYTKADVGKLLPVRWAKHDQYALIDAIKNNTPDNPGTEQIKAIVDEIADRAGSWGASETLMNRLYAVLNNARPTNGQTYKEAVMAGIKDITTASVKVKGIPKKIAEQLAKDGYIVARPMGKAGLRTPVVELEDTRKLITALDSGPVTIKEPNPALDGVSDDLVRSATKAKTFDDFLDSQSIFRGQKAEFENLQTVAQSDAIGNILIGRGVFTTTDPTVARSYGENIFRLSRPKDARRVLDLSNASDDVLDKIGMKASTKKLYRELVNEGPQTGYEGHIFDVDGEPWRVVTTVRDSKTGELQYRLANQTYGGGLKHVSVKEFEKAHAPSVSYNSQKDAEDLLFEAIAEKHLPDDVTWNMVKYGSENDLPYDVDLVSVRDTILQSLRKDGFDWIKHQGGIRAGGGSKLHDVYISLDDRVLKPVDEAKMRKIYEAAKNPTITRTIDNSATFEVAQMPHPILSAISGALDKSGLSLQSRNELSYNTLKNALAGTIDGTTAARELGITGRNLENGGDVILGRLQQYIENMKAAKVTRGLVGKTLGISRVPAVTDIRQLTVSEIEDALSGAGFRITRSGAKEIHTAVAEAYLKVPLELRGLGDRAVDLLQAAPIIGRANRAYTRVQSALRYTYNPFFRAQEATETAILAHMQANEVAPFLWKYGRSSLDETVTKLEDSGLFRSSLTGEAANDATFGRISANLSPSQRRNLAGLALDIAKRKGTTVEDLIQNHSDEIEDALKIVVQYPSKGVISSPLARTINIAFFPMRYNTKVTYLAAKKLGEMPPSIQLATLTGLYNMKTWLQSDEGLRWRSEHADAIQVFEWITPVGNIDQAMKLFGGSALSNTGGGITAPAELGLLGGLPFGLISQVLDSQGIIQLNRPYVDPKTGTVIPDYIPETTKARAAVALQDLLGMTFSFPGRTLGLPGKASTIREWVSTVIDTKTGEYNKLVREDQLTPLQKRMVDVVKNGGTDDDIDEALYHSPAEGQYDGYTLPGEQEFVVRPLIEQPFYEKRRGLPSGKKTGSKGKKKAQPIPNRA